jgi:hypothetical protein
MHYQVRELRVRSRDELVTQPLCNVSMHALRTYHAKLTVIGTMCDLHRYGESMCCHASHTHRYVCVVCGYIHLLHGEA